MLESMSDLPSMRGASRARFAPSLAVLVTAALAAMALASPAWYLGRQVEDQRNFLRSYRVPSDSEAYMACCADYATNSSESNDVVFLGGSTCSTGIETKRFEQLTGLSAYNLGAVGQLSIDGYALLLEMYLEHHPPPKVIVLCLLPFEVGPTRIPRSLPVAEPGREPTTAHDRFLWCYGRPGAYPRPSHANPMRYYVSQGLLVALGELWGGRPYYLDKPTLSASGHSYNSLKKMLSDTRGFCSLGDARLPATCRLEVGLSRFLPAEGATADDPFPVSPSFNEEARAIFRTVARHGVPLMIRLTPLLQSESTIHSVLIPAWFDRVEKEYPEITGDRPAILEYGAEYFADGRSHCNFSGADRFTAFVAGRVTNFLDKKNVVVPSTSSLDKVPMDANDHSQ